MQKKIAVLIPCYNEELSIGNVIKDFKKEIPTATIYVFDNNSKDRTIAEAISAGAVVREVRLQGKGNVVRRMFADIDADIYVLVDGDSTYNAADASVMIETLINQNMDMVVARRKTQDKKAYREGHKFGNWMLTSFVAWMFGKTFTDILSGYRVFSKRYVKSFPAISSGFEIETELTVHALELRMPVTEIESAYFSRPEGSISKLNTYVDGARILKTIFDLYRLEKPFSFFAIIASVFFLISFGIGLPIIVTYLETGLVPRFPSAILASGLSVIGTLFFMCGIILDTVTHGRRELKRLFYLENSSIHDNFY